MNDSFRYISTILAMVLGLGITRMLAGLIAIFRSRKLAQLDWIPVSWAFCILLACLQFWWAINNLPVFVWTFEEFIGLVFFTMLLFVSAALLLPDNLSDKGDLRTFFEQEGRYSLVALGAYFLTTIAVNWFYFKVPALRLWTAVELAMVAITIGCFFARSRRQRAVVSIIALPVFAIYVILLSDDWAFRYID